MVCPSEEVDAAWHQHLTFTRSYWQHFCRDVLRTPLHHEPTRGGPGELNKHRQMYRDTLASYERLFGHRPPRDIWPDVDARFGKPCRTNVVHSLLDRVRNQKEHGTRSDLISASVCFAFPLAFAANPFDFDGKTFLIFYMCLLFVAVAVAGCLRWSSSAGSEPSDESELTTDPLEIAYLAKGVDAVVSTAFTSLVSRQNLLIQSGMVSRGPVALPTNASLVERSLYEGVPTDTELAPSKLASTVRKARQHAEEYASRLRAEGLLNPTTDEPMTRRWIPFLLLVSVCAIGAIKILVGLSRDRPVGYLVVLTAMAGIVAGLFMMQSRRTARGTRVLQSLKESRRDLKIGDVGQMSPLDASLAAALFGTGLFAASTALPVDDFYRKMTHGDSSGSAASGCGGSSCSGGAGGGGGCGGGGCGGGCGGCGS